MWNPKHTFNLKSSRIFTLLLISAATLHTSHGQSCQMEGVTFWPVPVSEEIWDWYRGEVTNRATTNIEGINSVSYGGGLNRGPYLDVAISNSRFIMSTNAEYPVYEEYETSETMSLTINFSCTGGTSNNLVFIITVLDSNNNAPTFRPTDELQFTVMPPLPPGYLVTGCLNNIIVRDIDLTTIRIDFELEENPYFEIAYDSSISTDIKDFGGVLRTKTFIRSLPEPISLAIYATDVDRTNDPPITSTSQIRITSDLEFEMPDEPVFSQTFYLATYTQNDQVSLQTPILLQQGYDELVTFNLEGGYASYFELIQNGNQLSLGVTTQLPLEVLMEKQIFLIVRAEREYTSGSTATIILEMPEDVILEFERAHYTGSIIDNNLRLTPLILSQGYEGANISALLYGEHSSYFTTVVQGNVIIITMEPLNENVVSENNFIYLEIVASNGRSSGRAVITLEIIKDDNITPMFNQAMYNGNYDPGTGLIIDQIVIVQGFDDTVQVILQGDYSSYFQIVQEGPVIDLRVSPLPSEIYSEGQILLTIEASKPRTVGANAAIIITLPAARQLEFESSIYRGTLQDTELSLGTITLSSGYEENVIFQLTGDYVAHFSISNILNQVSVSLTEPLPASSIEDNNFITLTITASGDNALPTTAIIILEVIKDDTNTPVFNRPIYYGSYTGSSIEIENINLVQGYDSSVTFRIDGVHSEYFGINNIGNNIIVSLQSPIPEDVIFNEKILSFNIFAEKQLTVGANAAILINFPAELTDTAPMSFSQNTYIGVLENNVFTLEEIILNVGYASGTEFRLTGVYAEYFTLSNINNVVTLTSVITLPTDVVENNKFIILEIEAQRERAVSVSTTVLIDIVKEDVIPLVFNQAYYRGVYTEEEGLSFNEQISLSNGYNEAVDFYLEGDYADFFQLIRTGNSLTLLSVGAITENILESYNQLLLTVIATRPNAFSGRAVVSIDILKETSETVILRFNEISYIGSYDQGQLDLPIITLVDNNVDAYINITGEYAPYFSISRTDVIRIELINELPLEVINQNTIIVLDLGAYYPNSISGYAAVVIEIIKDSATTTPVFDRAYYSGEYSSGSGLLFEYTIQLTQGFDESVMFTLAGDDSQWFRLENRGANELSLALNNEGIQGIEGRNHLTFSVEADRPDSVPGNAAIIISLTDTSTSRILHFTRDFYNGTIENDILVLDTMSLIGYASDVTYELIGDYATYFQLSNQAGEFTLRLGENFPLNDLNNIIILTLEATIENARRTHATIIIEVLTNDETEISIIFEENYYVGSFSETSGLTFDSVIRLINGFNSDVSFSLSGDDSQWFEVLQSEDSVAIRQSSPIPPSTIASNSHLIFTILAQTHGSTVATATIIIALTDEFTGDTILGFERINYQGTIENNQVSLEPITLIQGYSADVVFTLRGEHESYFILSRVGASVTISLSNAIPEQLIPSSGLIVLEIGATAPQALAAYATVVLTVVPEDGVIDPIPDPIFTSAYYTGSYTASSGLTFETTITLLQGYDESVLFALEGEQSQWFELVQTGNSLALRLTTAIPPAVVATNPQLVFVVSAQRTGTQTARATIVITLSDEFTGDTILGFERINYQGTIENNQVSLEPITLIQGYSADIVFTLRGEHESYFILSRVGASVTISLSNAIPEQLIPSSGLIVLEIGATAPQALAAYATVVLTVVSEDGVIDPIPDPIFTSAYYTGSYTASSGLTFETTITLLQGYDESVLFALEGEQSQWFELVQTGNSLALRLTTAIPPAAVATNPQLVFVVSAQRTGTQTARATIVITLSDEFTGDTILGFERINYQGTIENNQVSLEPITLIQGYSADVVFTLRGEHESYFVLSRVGASVTISLSNAIPEQLIPSSGLIVLEIGATAPQALAAYATVVLTVVPEDGVIDPIPDPIFTSAYYTGSYTASSGLTFETTITLLQGYDESVLFALEGEQSQWFELVQTGNSLALRLTTAIPPAVVATNPQLVFVVSAQRTGTQTARATIVITLSDEFTGDTILGFERINYQGTIENNQVSLEPITLIQGYSADVVFTLRGEHESYFILSRVGASVTISLSNAIPEQLIPSSGLIVLEIGATAPQALAAYATVVLTVVPEDGVIDPIPDPIFTSAYYTGSYTASSGLTFENTITLLQGYDESVLFALEGEQSQWFELVQTGNSLALRLTTAIPPAVVATNPQLVFVVSAQRTGTQTARATIVITLSDEFTGDTILGFERINYQGTIENNQVSLEPITLIQGYSADVVFTLRGEHESYFILSRVGASVTISLSNAIPEQQIPSSGLIVLEIGATAPQALAAYATVVLTVVSEDGVIDPIPDPIFTSAYYTGSYTASSGLTFENTITLLQGYDESVLFALEGEQSQWFELVQTGNSLALRLTTAIPPAVVATNPQLVFVVSAQRTGTQTARATIVITLSDEFTGDTILGFERINYQGTIENNQVSLEPITLIQGYSADVVFTLRGEHESYFILSRVGASVTISLSNAIPEQLIPSSGLIVLEIGATAPQALAAYATVVLTVVSEDGVIDPIPDPIFTSAYYTGSYTASSGLTFENTITLLQGYDESVLFALEGEQSQWFELVQTGNSLALRLTTAIPPAVVATNPQLVFVVSAQRTGTQTARATIVITLSDEFTGDTILGFERINYQGTIENNQVSLEPITLIQGYSADVVFTLRGEHESYFILSRVGASVTISLSNAIPEQLIPSSGLIVLEIGATAPQALAAYATVVLTVVSEDGVIDPIPDPIFTSAYYTGSYTASSGLTFENTITLLQGYDESVLFALEGEQSQWFELVQTGNSLALRLTTAIPPAVVATNPQLVFVVSAQRTGTQTARATIVITLSDEFTGDTILGFERINYQGTIENNQVSLEPITLIQGYSADVVFTLRGEHESYFILSRVGASVTISLSNAIPEQLIPSSGLIVLEIGATAPQALAAYATVVLTVVPEDGVIDPIPDPIFTSAYYTGSYTASSGLTFENTITLSQGYDESVRFALEGEQSQWFELVQTGNSLALRLTTAIPPAVVATNPQLVFVVSAQRTGTQTARATIVITLSDEFTGDTILGFERINYQGTIENNQVSLEPITLIQGYSADVVFTLRGEHESYFILSRVGASVTISLSNAIPEQLIPSSGLIVLEIGATAPQALAAYATVVLTVVSEDGVIDPIPDPIFTSAYYTGSYTASSGLTFENTITLLQGYDESVLFALEGEQSQWFELVQTGNSLALRLTTAIPPAVVATNTQLVFVVSAQRTGTQTARATIVITLSDEFTGDTILGFERINYQGTIENNQVSLEPITLIQGYSADIVFTLRGEHESYFILSRVGASVTISLSNAIPEQLIPSSGLIVLEIGATAPQALAAYATVVLTVVSEDGVIDPIPDPIFTSAYYTGSYTASSGLTFENTITLLQGYDESVLFALEGEQSQWFELVQTGNSLALRLTTAIPPAVVATNPQLVFVVSAQRTGTQTARATIVITLSDEFTGDTILGFERINYQGTIENNQVSLEPITLIQGYSADVVFTLRGEHESYFILSRVGASVTISLSNAIPEQLIPSSGLIVLEIGATAPQALAAYATVVLTVVSEDGVIDPIPDPIFTSAYYTGSYTASSGLTFENTITLLQGYDESVLFALEGEQSQWFELVQTGNSLALRLTTAIPPAVVATNPQLVFVVSAQRTGTQTARATIVITLSDEFTGDTILGFERINYQGTIENNQVSLEPITLIQGYSADVVFTLRGEHESYFILSRVGASVTISLSNAIPEQLIPSSGLIVLEIGATAPQALAAYATVVLTVVSEDGVIDPIPDPIFTSAYYTGSYTASSGLTFENTITLLQGYDESVLFALEGEQSQWFELVQTGNSLALRLTTAIPPAVVATNPQLVFVVSAQRTGTQTARATIVITLSDEFTGDTILGFERINYQGTIENNQVSLEPITLIQGYSADVAFTLRGELESYFILSPVGASVTIYLRSAIPEQLIPSSRLIVVELGAAAPQALSAYATVVFIAQQETIIDPINILEFDEPYYSGSYSTTGSFIFNSVISLSRGYDTNVVFYLEGEHSQWFDLIQSGNTVTLQLLSPIPPDVLARYLKLIFVVSAQSEGSITARATIVISLIDDTPNGVDVYFEKVLYNGIVQNNIIQHESITVVGFTGTNIDIVGEYSSLFVAYVSEQAVTVERSGLDALPDDVTHVAIELHAGPARAVLILTVMYSGTVNQPLVTFTASSYTLRTEVAQTGLLGRVTATADNGEAVTYFLVLDNVHLQSRLSINNEGELYLSAPAESGVYTFEVVATTIFTQATGTATVHLTVDSITVCGDDELVVPPLIILDRDEEEPHRNLVMLDTSQHEGCWYSLTNRWPIDQTWLYVDATGLHATSIDREDTSIAFMALSQIQVELVLHCTTDNTVRSKRAVEDSRLGPYDYGNNKWILTDTIQYNSRRSFVNLIVNDINDNAPIFIGKDQEPIAVGYPVPELIDTVVPRALAELQATDADIGENAELLYWSSEPVLAVAPTTGFVHLRDGAQIDDNLRLTIHATDQNGGGLTGSIDIMVRLLDTSNIVVMTIRDAFLEDEKNITQELSNNVGYELKVLRSAVVSADTENESGNLRTKRDTDPAGASLQLYVYGLIAREPVTVERLTTDINNIAIATVSITSTVSLEDYLEGREICVIAGRDTGLLVATIVLSVLLFIILVSIALWYFLKWRKENYDQFSDENSLASRNGSLNQLPKPEPAPKTRLNIEDLKRSERRLQEMLDAPIQEVSIEPSSSKIEKPYESILDLPPPDSHVPIVIQSIDKLKDPEEDSDEDEFGEKNKTRRKSVVTFNENVEKIIHVEDDDDTGSQQGYEIYKL